jgi:hypothetical protein
MSLRKSASIASSVLPVQTAGIQKGFPDRVQTTRPASRKRGDFRRALDGAVTDPARGWRDE